MEDKFYLKSFWWFMVYDDGGRPFMLNIQLDIDSITIILLVNDVLK